MRAQMRADPRGWRGWAATAVVSAVLGADAGVHGNLARQAWSGWQPVTPAQLFALEALAAAAVGLALLISDRQIIWAAAAFVALGSLAAVLVSRYVDIPAIGPIPSMYEPIWYGQKTWSALAEGLGGVLAVLQLVPSFRRAAPADRRSDGVVRHQPQAQLPVTINTER